MKDQESQKMCKNCERSHDPAYRYCPYCGQEHKEKIVDFKRFLLDFLGDYFTFDSLIFRSVKPLLFNPGFLTREFLAGKRVRYIPPLRLYIFISIVFFLILGSVDQSIELEKEDLDSFLDSYFDTWFPRLFFCLLPLFAFFLYMLFRKPGRFYLNHFIFSVHFHAFVFVLSTLLIILIEYIFPSSVFLSQWAFFIYVLLLEVYLLIALKKVYEQSWVVTFFKLLLLNFIYSISAMLIFAGVGAMIYSLRY